jgi:hypothetical protein
MNLKKALVSKLRTRLGITPYPAMSLDNVYAYLDAIYKKRAIDGDIVEIGVAEGGTSAMSYKFLRRFNSSKAYYCVDTFSGFVKEHLDHDHELGLKPEHDNAFSGNDKSRFESRLHNLGIKDKLHVIQGDICTLPSEALPNKISVCLLDVDLRDPIYGGLEKVCPLMAPGGVILVDDCKSDTSWVGARAGFRDYVEHFAVDAGYFMGLGVIEIPGDESAPLDWDLSDTPNACFR